MNKDKGDFIKAVGADWGAFWNGKFWVRFECFGCAMAEKVLTGKRLNNAEFKSIKIGPDNRLNTILHNTIIHNKWLSDGKPSPMNKIKTN